ncbi:hypothetical protein [Paenisporosarcina sp. OV554]|uniref:DUF6843 domain-containing protein n=1 Tax=Paenisporosarcina sp. OV554 TaxID=2135694 RepID=UPI000D350178|nr:hypothetical protein [Paenisporosarcina sp. OV554]PUB08163.1 hypothetical protein C8K15_1441 [Paenisporosarcina sp. OV554]
MIRIAFLIGILLVGGCSFNETEYTNDIYLIPEGYEGSIIIFYGIPGEPVLEQQGDFSVIPVKKEFLESMALSEYPYYGVSLTSTPYENEGEITNDKFFYVDSNGERTSIQEECIHQRGTGGFTNNDETSVVYYDFQVTMSECGQKFWFDGKDSYFDQLKEVKDYWFNELY